MSDSFDVEFDWRPWSLWAVAVDSAGNESCWGAPLQLNGGLAVEPAPSSFWLGAPRPNPARDLVAVPFCLSEAGTASLEVFDLQGRRVATLVRGYLAAGVHVRIWRAGDSGVGIFVVRLRSGTWASTRRLLVLR